MILYSYSDTTIMNLVQEFGAPLAAMHLGAFRKQASNCPHCEHKRKEWLEEPLVVEVALVVDFNYGPSINPEEYACVICECPKCGKKNVYHYPLRMLADEDFIDKDIIQAEMDKRGLVDGWKPKEEGDEEQAQFRMMQKIQQTQAALGMGMLGVGGSDKEIPDYSIKCTGKVRHKDAEGYYTGTSEPCTEIWTKENTNPRWMTDTILVARCPVCGMQTQIQDRM